MASTNNQRLVRLLDSLTATSFRPAPKGVGSKTAIVARELGLVEFEGASGRWRFRLTQEGLGLRREYRAIAQAGRGRLQDEGEH